MCYGSNEIAHEDTNWFAGKKSSSCFSTSPLLRLTVGQLYEPLCNMLDNLKETFDWVALLLEISLCKTHMFYIYVQTNGCFYVLFQDFIKLYTKAINCGSQEKSVDKITWNCCEIALLWSQPQSISHEACALDLVNVFGRVLNKKANGMMEQAVSVSSVSIFALLDIVCL